MDAPAHPNVIPLRGRVVAIVQARVGSSRLPGKVLAELEGDTMLGRVIQRLRATARVDDIVIATSTSLPDGAVAREAGRLGVACHRGSEQDVLARYLDAAREAHADVIVRVTADCPLLDPAVIDDVIAALGRDVDYASNTHGRTFPQGLDVEAMHRDVLERMARLGTSAPAREHVTALMMEAPELFRIRQVTAARDDSDLRLTVDTADDLALVRALYAALHLGAALRPYREVVEHLRAHPALRELNAHVRQKAWNHHGS